MHRFGPRFALCWLRRLTLLIVPAWFAVAQSATASIAPLAVDQVAPGVFVHIGALEDWTAASGGDVANIGFIVGNRCVAVIDTGGTPDVGRALRAAVERATALPVCYVINTHAHPDHILGDVAFAESKSDSTTNAASAPAAPTPKFVASARFNRTLAAREPYYLNSLQRDFNIALTHAQIIYSSVAVDSTLELDLGDRMLSLRAWPTAHTDNDLTVLDLRTRTLFAADLIFVQHLPALDGSLRGWVGAMAELKRLDVQTVVPGHGAVSKDWPAAMNAQAEYLNGLLRDTRAAIRKQLTIQQAIDTVGLPPGSHWLLTDRFHKRNVTAAYAELEWEDDDAKPAVSPSASSPVRAPSASSVRQGG
jgi:quinoprotein relay system zinc metallohydrolase 2